MFTKGIQRAVLREEADVPAAALLDNNPSPSVDEVESAMADNICRCGCYPRIKQAILNVAAARGQTLEEMAEDLATEKQA